MNGPFRQSLWAKIKEVLLLLCVTVDAIIIGCGKLYYKLQEQWCLLAVQFSMYNLNNAVSNSIEY